MEDLLLDYVVLPMPFLWLLIIAFILVHWVRLSQAIFILATLVFALVSVPFIAQLMTLPLTSTSKAYAAAGGQQAVAIVAPTGGSFNDGTGQWRPTNQSWARGNAALRLQRESGLPLIISGGSVWVDQPAEAETLAQALGLAGAADEADPTVRLETTGRNSAETAAAIASMLEGTADPVVVLVTSPSHMARMSAALRHNGVDVLAQPVRVPERGAKVLDSGLWNFVPSYRGFKRAQAAFREYLAIGWYMATGRLAPEDLWPGNA